MKFTEFMEKRLNITQLSDIVDVDLYVQDSDIYIKHDDSIAVKDYIQYNNAKLIQLLSDFVDKKYAKNFELKDRLHLLTYTESNDSEVDQYINARSRVYQHKPLVCLIKNIESHNYIIGYHHKDINVVLDYLGDPKADYSLMILDGKFKATKTILDNGIIAYVMSKEYSLRNADGVTDISINNKEYQLKHIRRKI